MNYTQEEAVRFAICDTTRVMESLRKHCSSAVLATIFTPAFEVPFDYGTFKAVYIAGEIFLQKTIQEIGVRAVNSVEVRQYRDNFDVGLRIRICASVIL